jgi:hypothetical protein
MGKEYMKTAQIMAAGNFIPALPSSREHSQGYLLDPLAPSLPAPCWLPALHGLTLFSTLTLAVGLPTDIAPSSSVFALKNWILSFILPG